VKLSRQPLGPPIPGQLQVKRKANIFQRLGELQATDQPVDAMPEPQTPELQTVGTDIPKTPKHTKEAASQQETTAKVQPSVPKSQTEVKIPSVDQQVQMWEPSAISRKRGPILPGLVSTEPASTPYSLEKAEITAPLKVDPQKIVVMAKFDGNQRVLKVGVSSGFFVKTNVLGGQWIKRLNLKGITAPNMAVVPITEAGLDRVLKGLDAEDSTLIRESLAKVDSTQGQSVGAMVSDFAPGTDVEQLVDAPRYADLDEYKNPPKTPEAATDAYVKMLEKTARKSPLGKTLPAARKPPFGGSDGWGDELSDQPPAQGPGFQAWLKDQDTFVNELDTASNISRAMAKYKLQVHLAKLGAPLAQKAIASKMDIIVNQSPKFKKWLGTSTGRDAVIRQICLDVIIGQEDRLINFQGGNFKFDLNQNTLVDTDNGSKSVDPLTAHDLTQPLPKYEAWLDNIRGSGSLPEALVQKLAQGELGPDLATVKLANVRAILKQVAKEADKVARLNPKEDGATAMIDRAAKIQALL
jgi:hypothetical protein